MSKAKKTPETEPLSEFGKQLAAVLEMAGPWEGAGKPTFTDLLTQAMKKHAALGVELDRATRLNAILSTSNSRLREELGEAVDHAKTGWARLSQVEAARDELKQELAEQEREKLALVQENTSLAMNWYTPASKEPFAFVPYLVAVRLGEGLNKGEVTTLKRTCHWDSVDKVWVRHGVSPRSILPKEVVYYAEIPAAPTSAAPLVAEAAPADWFPPTVFSSAAAYDASVASGVERIKSGEIQPIGHAIPEPKSQCEHCGRKSLDTCPSGCLFGTGGICPSCGKYLSYKLIAAAPTTTGEGKRDE